MVSDQLLEFLGLDQPQRERFHLPLEQWPFVSLSLPARRHLFTGTTSWLESQLRQCGLGHSVRRPAA